MTSNVPTFHVGSDDELTRLWRRLLAAESFEQRSLWVIFLDQYDRTLPVIFPVDDLPDQPDDRLVHNLAAIVDNILATTTAVATAFLLSRPGPENMTDFDRRWARSLLATFAGSSRYGPIHVATRNRVRVIAADDLVAADRSA